jgi:branched-chain amino acid transport system ATP-binding protein
MEQQTLLQSEDIRKDFGGIHAVRDLNVSINKGEIVGMIGPNGSGKTTFFNILSSIYRPDSGTIRFKGEDITHLPIYAIVAKGITRTFQNLRVFRDISVLENVLIGRHHLINTSLLHLYFNPFLALKREKEAYLKAIELLRLVHLENQEREYARNLPYGQQRLLEIARGLMAEPDLLLLDEPTAGMNPKEVAVLCSFLEEVRERGFSLFIIEHNMKAIMSLADRIIVLNAGAKIREGTPSEIQADEEVKEIYLGKEED